MPFNNILCSLRKLDDTPQYCHFWMRPWSGAVYESLAISTFIRKPSRLWDPIRCSRSLHLPQNRQTICFVGSALLRESFPNSASIIVPSSSLTVTLLAYWINPHSPTSKPWLISLAAQNRWKLRCRWMIGALVENLREHL